MVGSAHRKSTPTSRRGLWCMIVWGGFHFGGVLRQWKSCAVLSLWTWTVALMQVTQQHLKQEVLCRNFLPDRRDCGGTRSHWETDKPFALSSCGSCCHACLFLLPTLPKCSDQRKGSRCLMGSWSERPDGTVSYNSGLQFWGKNFRMKTKRNFLKSCQNI